MIIADTSIWVEYLRLHEPILTYFVKELDGGNILSIDCVLGELLQGIRREDELKRMLWLWEVSPKIYSSDFWVDAGVYSSRLRLTDKGIGIIDAVIITAARKYEAKIWTLDKKMMAALQPHEIFKP